MEIKGFQGEFRWLSNFFPAKVIFEGLPFPTVEHAYQAAKVEDIETRKQIQQLSSPGKAKKFRKIIRSDWELIKLLVMEDLLRQKFQIPELQDKLLVTGNCYIEETNYWGDYYWGVCNGVGNNHLGKLIMKIRKETLK